MADSDLEECNIEISIEEVPVVNEEEGAKAEEGVKEEDDAGPPAVVEKEEGEEVSLATVSFGVGDVESGDPPTKDEPEENDDIDDEEENRKACGPMKWIQCGACFLLVLLFILLVLLLVEDGTDDTTDRDALVSPTNPPKVPTTTTPSPLTTASTDPPATTGVIPVSSPSPTSAPTTVSPTFSPTTASPTSAPTTAAPTIVVDFQTTQFQCQGIEFNESTTEWYSITANTVVGEAGFDFSGFGLAMSGDGAILAVGSPENDANGDNTGNVRIFQLNENNSSTAVDFVQLGQSISGVAINDKFGGAVSLSNNGLRMAAGARWNNGSSIPPQEDVGQVRVFDYSSGNGNWTQVGQDLQGILSNDQLGGSVALSGDGTTVAIGVLGADDVTAGLSNNGYVIVYGLEEESALWVQMGQEIRGVADEDQAGSSVSMSYNGLRVAVGAIFYDEITTTVPLLEVGHVRVFDYNQETEAWEQVGQELVGENEGDYAGSTVSLSDDGLRVAVGLATQSSSPGITHVYELVHKEWIRLGADLKGGGAVALSQNGMRVVVGDYRGATTGSNAGHVVVYEYDSATDSWLSLGQEINGVTNELSGMAVALSGDGNRVASASPLSVDGNSNFVGVTRVYDLC